MTDTPDQLEHEVEAHRASVESTLDALKDRLSINNAMEHVGQFIGVADTNAALQAASHQLRENPIAFGLIGLGAAWLVLGSSGTKAHGRRNNYDTYTDDTGEWRAYRGRDTGMANNAMNAVSGASNMISGAVSAAGSTIAASLTGARKGSSAPYEDVTGRTSEMKTSHFDETRHLRDQMTDQKKGDHYEDRDGLTAYVRQQPLLFGAAALVIGAVIAAAMPRTRMEGQMTGQHRDDLLDDSTSRERALSAADDAFGAGRDGALVSEGDNSIMSGTGRAEVGENTASLVTDRTPGASATDRAQDVANKFTS